MENKGKDSKDIKKPINTREQIDRNQNGQLNRIGSELFPIVAGVSFGYNIALLAGDVVLNTGYSTSWLSISLLLGAIVGCISVMLLKQIRNQDKILKVGVVISLITSLWGGMIFLSNNSVTDSLESALCAIRFFMGITAGLSCVAPVYLVEELPKRLDSRRNRGAYFSWYQLSITAGILLVYTLMFLYDLLKQEGSETSYNNYYAITFFIYVIISLAFLITLFSVKTNALNNWENRLKEFDEDKSKVKRILEKKSDSNGHLKKDLEKNWKTLEEPDEIKKGSWYKVYKAALYTGVGIIAIQQAVGINIVIFKLPELLNLFSVGKNGVLFFLLMIGVINVLSTLPGMLMVDRIGRRALFLLGMLGITFSLGLLTFLVMKINPDDYRKCIPDKFYVLNHSIEKKSSSGDFVQGEYCYIVDACSFKTETTDNQMYLKNEGDCLNQIISFSQTKIFLQTIEGSKIYNEIKKIHPEKLGKKENEKGIVEYELHFNKNMLKKIDDVYYFKPLFLDNSKRIGLVIFISFITVYMIFFACSLGILGWLVPAEILPIKIRNRGMAIISATHWMFNLAIVLFFDIYNVSAFFIFFFISSIIAIFFGFYYFPETNGKSLREIDYFWRGSGKIDEFNNPDIFDKKTKKAMEASDEYKKRVRVLHAKLTKKLQVKLKRKKAEDATKQS